MRSEETGRLTEKEIQVSVREETVEGRTRKTDGEGGGMRQVKLERKED